jgi:hypothetical protein
MFGFYTPIVLLQAFCVYHAYRNRAEQRWYWFILLFPFIGSLIYLFHFFYNRQNIETLAESVKGVVNSNYKIEQFEKAHVFADTLTNRLNLAEAYLQVARNEEAITLYRESLIGFMSDDVSLRMKLLHALFLNGNYNEVVTLGVELESEKEFKEAEQRLAYAWALHYSGKTEEAEVIFMSMNKSFTNYVHRKEYCRFLADTGRTDEMREKASEILHEIDIMRGPEKKLYRDIMHEVKTIQNSVVSS